MPRYDTPPRSSPYSGEIVTYDSDIDRDRSRRRYRGRDDRSRYDRSRSRDRIDSDVKGPRYDTPINNNPFIDLDGIQKVMNDVYDEMPKNNIIIDFISPNDMSILCSDQLPAESGGGKKHRKMKGGAPGVNQNNLLAMPQGRKIVLIIKLLSALTTVSVLAGTTSALLLCVTQLISFLGLTPPFAKLIYLLYDIFLCKSKEAVSMLLGTLPGTGRFFTNIIQAIGEVLYSFASLRILGAGALAAVINGILTGTTRGLIDRVSYMFFERPIIAIGNMPGNIRVVIQQLYQTIRDGFGTITAKMQDIQQYIQETTNVSTIFTGLGTFITTPYYRGVEFMCGIALEVYTHHNVVAGTELFQDINRIGAPDLGYVTQMCTGINIEPVIEPALNIFVNTLYSIPRTIITRIIKIGPFIFEMALANRREREMAQAAVPNPVQQLDIYLERCRASITAATSTRRNLMYFNQHKVEVEAELGEVDEKKRILTRTHQILKKLESLTEESSRILLRTFPIPPGDNYLLRTKAISRFSAIGSVAPQLLIGYIDSTNTQIFTDFGADTIRLGDTRINFITPANPLDIAILMISTPSEAVNYFRVNNQPISQFIVPICTPGDPILENQHIEQNIVDFFNPQGAHPIDVVFLMINSRQAANANALATQPVGPLAPPPGPPLGAAAQGPGAAGPGGGSRRRRKTRRRKQQRRRTRRF